MILEKLGIPDNIIYSAKKLWDETISEVDYQYDDLIGTFADDASQTKYE